jgi:aminoglycoside 6'-N-acetyltransferase I
LNVELCTWECLDEWVRLRRALWPHASEQELRLEAAAILHRPDDQIAFIARGENATAIAFAEATLRRDYVNGCATSPVGFLEGLYVDPDFRTRGIARLLCDEVENWAVGLGCSEFASDVDLGNEASQKAHEALGFEETERVVYYRKLLRRK